ncbi:hypothetical protein N7475_009162 [Penicillium sp. IBT 31633x]|nr:hypothetical protein N7475_009162 [Penicillium sp. IBT 31633x]
MAGGGSVCLFQACGRQQNVWWLNWVVTGWLAGIVTKNRADEASLSVNLRKAAERMVASSFFFQDKQAPALALCF